MKIFLDMKRQVIYMDMITKLNLEKIIHRLEVEKLNLMEISQEKEVKSAISHIDMAEDFIADLVFLTEEE